MHMLRVRGGAPPLNHEEIHSIMHQPDDGYFSNAEGEHPADQAPYYIPNGMFIEWPQWDDRWWWIRCANGMDVQGHSYWCFSRHPLDPSVESMPFRMVESLAHLRLVEEAIDENRSYLRDIVSDEGDIVSDEDESDIVSDEKRAQVLEHGQPAAQPACGSARCGSGIRPWSRHSVSHLSGRGWNGRSFWQPSRSAATRGAVRTEWVGFRSRLDGEMP